MVGKRTEQRKMSLGAMAKLKVERGLTDSGISWEGQPSSTLGTSSRSLSPEFAHARFVSTYRFLASRKNTQRTTVLTPPAWLQRFPRLSTLYSVFDLLQHRKQFHVALTSGDLCGLAFAALQRLLPGRRLPTILVDCLWYRELRVWRRYLKRWQMRFCLRGVDRCVVWAEREVETYAREFGVDPAKFVFVPHHMTLHPHRYSFVVSNGNYIFAGGNGMRDYRTFVEAVKPLKCPCVIACTDDRRLKAIELPAHVRRVRASGLEFRQLMAGAMIVVVPLEGGQIHFGGQQSFVNAMALGKPVVVTDSEGASSYVEHGVTGLLVPPHDVTALCEALRFLLADDRRRRDIGERARQVAQNYTVENCYNRICALADEVAHA